MDLIRVKLKGFYILEFVNRYKKQLYSHLKVVFISKQCIEHCNQNNLKNAPSCSFVILSYFNFKIGIFTEKPKLMEFYPDYENIF